jgi:hypothetical protein
MGHTSATRPGTSSRKEEPQNTLKNYLKTIDNNNNNNSTRSTKDDSSQMLANVYEMQKTMMKEMKQLRTTFGSHFERHEKQIGRLNKNVKHHDDELNRIEQNSLSCFMTISGLEVNVDDESSDVTKQVVEYLTKNEFEFSPFQIVCARVVKYKTRNGTNEHVLVKFLDEHYKISIMSQRRNKPPVYFNHQLTRFNRSLLRSAKELKKQKQLTYATVQNGCVTIKLSEKSEKLKITSHDQLKELVSGFSSSQRVISEDSDESDFVTPVNNSQRGTKRKKNRECNQKFTQNLECQMDVEENEALMQPSIAENMELTPAINSSVTHQQLQLQQQ